MAYFNRRLGRANITKLQQKEADRIRETYADRVTEAFNPIIAGKLDWPYKLGEIDLMKLAWAFKIEQKEILVPEWVKE